MKTLFKIRVLRTQTQRMKTLQNGGQISFQYITAGLSEPEKRGHTSRLEHQMLCLYTVPKGFDFEDHEQAKKHTELSYNYHTVTKVSDFQDGDSCPVAHTCSADTRNVNPKYRSKESQKGVEMYICLFFDS